MSAWTWGRKDEKCLRRGPGFIPGEGTVSRKWIMGVAAALETRGQTASSQTWAGLCAVNGELAGLCAPFDGAACKWRGPGHGR